MAIEVTSGGQSALLESTSSQGGLSYTAPSLSILSPTTSYTSATVDGNIGSERVVLTISGKNFGTANASAGLPRDAAAAQCDASCTVL